MTVAELRRLPASEKLKIIETLWADLAVDADSLESPAWHGEELRKTEAAMAAGEIEVLDWQTAKKELGARLK
jgi:Putative addiction module component